MARRKTRALLACSIPTRKRSRRLWAATEAQAIGYGGIAQVAGATGYTSRIVVLHAWRPFPQSALVPFWISSTPEHRCIEIQLTPLRANSGRKSLRRRRSRCAKYNRYVITVAALRKTRKYE